MLPRLLLAAIVPSLLAITLPSVASAQPGAYGPPPPPPQVVRRQAASPRISLGLGIGHHWQENERDGGEASLLAGCRSVESCR